MYKPGSKFPNADGLSQLPMEDYVTPLPCPEEVVLSISALDLTPVTSKTIAFYTSRDPVQSQVRKWILHGWPEKDLLIFNRTQPGRMSFRNNWVVFYGDHGWLSQESVAILYWENSMRVIQKFLRWSLWLVVTFGGLRWMHILNCVWRIVACAKILQKRLRLVPFMHGNGQEGPGSEYTWIMRALSRASGF